MSFSVLSLNLQGFPSKTYCLTLKPHRHGLLINVSPKSFQSHSPLRPFTRQSAVRCAAEESKDVPWDFSRFVKTVVTFNPPPTPSEVMKRVSNLVLQSDSSETSRLVTLQTDPRSPSGVVMVVGASGPVGRRVIMRLLHCGKRVRALVRDVPEAEALLRPMLAKTPDSGTLQLVAGDLSRESSLKPGIFQGVTQLIHCASPTGEVAGLGNLLSACRGVLPQPEGRLIFGRRGPGLSLEGSEAWAPLDDVVMGGASESQFRLDPNGGETGAECGVFSGVVTSANRGGFVSVRTRNYSPPLDLSAFTGLSLRLKGTGTRFKLILRADTNWDSVSFSSAFDTEKDVWQTVTLPFDEFVPVFRASTLKDGTKLSAETIYSIQILYSKFEYDGELNPNFQEGSFAMNVEEIRAYSSSPVAPAFILVESGGASADLRGESDLRGLGVPYTIIRPAHLTEEPAGAPLECSQQCNSSGMVEGKIGCDDLADLVVAASNSTKSVNMSFDVKSTVPVGEMWQGAPSDSEEYSGRNVENYFAGLDSDAK